MLHRIDEAKAPAAVHVAFGQEIAFRVGYRSEVNFITAFTEKTGATPTGSAEIRCKAVCGCGAFRSLL